MGRLSWKTREATPLIKIIIPGLQALIAFQCALFAAYLIAGRKLDRLANRINLGLLLAFAIHMLFNLINQHLFVAALPPISFGFGLLYGPLILFYIKSLVYRDFRWRRNHWLHLLPAGALCLLPLAVAIPAWFAALAIFVSLACYLALAIAALHRFRRVLVSTQSAQDVLAMDWAWRLLRFTAWVLLANVISVALQYGGGPVLLGQLAEIALFLVLLTLVSAFVFKGLLQPQLFAGISDEDQQIADHRPTAGSELDEPRQSAIEQALLSHMETRKPYLEPLLSLGSLGRQLGETPRYVSQVINTRLGKSFSDFINGYRIEEAKRRLAERDSERPILDILLDCGFSTKSNFNRAFKQHVGMTPSEFRKRASLDPGAR